MRLAILQDGSIMRVPTSGGDWYALTLPTGVSRAGNNAPPSIRQYEGDTIICGCHTEPLVVTEFGQVLRNGVAAPETAPVLTQTGGASITAEVIGYCTFLIRSGSRVIAESNPSPASATLSLSNGAVLWSSIPTSSNANVTHVRGYRRDDGEVGALAWEAPIGTTTYTDTKATTALGVTLPVKTGLDGATTQDNNARGVVPYCKYVEMYHRAAWYAGDPDHPERVYYSKIEEPQAVNVNADDKRWFNTRGGEAVTGLKRRGDELVVFSKHSADLIQGYSESDYSIIRLSNFYGCISNLSAQNVGPNGDIWFASQEGPAMYMGGGPGGFRFMFEDQRDAWRDAYRADTTRYEQCFAAEDRYYGAYILQIPQSDSSTYRYVGHYEPVYRYGGQPWWTVDIRDREESCMGTFVSGQFFGDLYSGSCDGHIRRENIASDTDDDSDSYAKALSITHKHFMFRDPSGDDNHARTFTDMDVFAETENQAATVSVYAGDESAINAASAQFSESLAASAVTTPRAKVAKTTHAVGPISGASGKGVTVKVTASAPTGFKYRGFSIRHKEGGQQPRPYSE